MSRTYNRRSEIRRRVRERAAGMCEICGVVLDPSAPLTASNSPSMHHRHPRRAQGRDAVWNLLYLDRRCHLAIHLDEDIARAFGYLLSEEDPQHPLLHRSGWAVVDDTGDVSRVRLPRQRSRTIRALGCASITPPWITDTEIRAASIPQQLGLHPAALAARPK